MASQTPPSAAEVGGYFPDPTQPVNLNYLVSNKFDKLDTLPLVQRIATLQGLISLTSGKTGIHLPDWPTMDAVRDEWRNRRAMSGNVHIYFREQRALNNGDLDTIRMELYCETLFHAMQDVVSSLTEQGLLDFETFAEPARFSSGDY
jgi:hypothetical protein